MELGGNGRISCWTASKNCCLSSSVNSSSLTQISSAVSRLGGMGYSDSISLFMAIALQLLGFWGCSGGVRSEKTAAKTVILAIFGAILGERSQHPVSVSDSFGRGAIGEKRRFIEKIGVFNCSDRKNWRRFQVCRLGVRSDYLKPSFFR